MPLSKARRVSLADTVSNQLADAIVSGEFPAGAPLQEVAIAQQLGVSRAPVREALIELQMRGLVQFDDQGRTRVPALAPADIREIHAVRLALDPLAAALAAEHATAADLGRIEETITAMQSAATLQELARHDTGFHEAVVQAGRNSRLVACWTMLRDQVELWLTQMHLRDDGPLRDRGAFTAVRDRSVQSHRDLLTAIRSGPTEAAAVGRRHVADWIASLPAGPA